MSNGSRSGCTLLAYYISPQDQKKRERREREQDRKGSARKDSAIEMASGRRACPVLLGFSLNGVGSGG